MEFYEALFALEDYIWSEDKYACLICGHRVKFEWAIWRHADNKHSDLLYDMSGQAHGWNNARMGCE